MFLEKKNREQIHLLVHWMHWDDIRFFGMRCTLRLEKCGVEKCVLVSTLALAALENVSQICSKRLEWFDSNWIKLKVLPGIYQITSLSKPIESGRWTLVSFFWKKDSTAQSETQWNLINRMWRDEISVNNFFCLIFPCEIIRDEWSLVDAKPICGA